MNVICDHNEEQRVIVQYHLMGLKASMSLIYNGFKPIF